MPTSSTSSLLTKLGSRASTRYILRFEISRICVRIWPSRTQFKRSLRRSRWACSVTDCKISKFVRVLGWNALAKGYFKIKACDVQTEMWQDISDQDVRTRFSVGIVSFPPISLQHSTMPQFAGAFVHSGSNEIAHKLSRKTTDGSICSVGTRSERPNADRLQFGRSKTLTGPWDVLSVLPVLGQGQDCIYPHPFV